MFGANSNANADADVMSQFDVNTAMMLVTQLSLTTMESLENGVATHSRVTLFVSIVVNESCVTSIISSVDATLGR